METTRTLSGIETKPVDRGAMDRSPCVAAHKLVFDNVSVFYGEHPAVSEASFSACRGCITAVIGPSGCGKTSFLLALNRMLEMIPGARASGRVLLDGIDVLAHKDVLEVRRRIGMLFQKPNPFPLSIFENVAFALREHGIRRRDALRGKVQGALEAVGLWSDVKDRLHRSALGLSGGQQQRLCLARAIALEPEVLLLDEPCSALDPASTATIEKLMRELARRYTILVVTHNLAQARRVSDYCAYFLAENGEGRLIEYGSTQQIFSAPRDPRTAEYVEGRLG